MSKIKIFHPLSLPHLDGSREKQWCTYSTDDDYVYLLNGNRCEVANIANINVYTDIHFDTEEECHLRASKYYTRYGREYPYMKEWSKAILNDKSVPATNTIQSEVMRFA